MNVVRLFQTVRHLRLVQISSRFARLLPRRSAVMPRVAGWRAPSRWVTPATRARSLFAGPELHLLGERIAIDAQAWNDRKLPDLLRYNIHYHDDLASAGGDAALQRAFIAQWIADNPPFAGIGWDAYPTSLRIVNWCKWLLAGNAPVDGQLASLALQAEHVSRNIERHLLANHVLANAKALRFASTLLDSDASDRWRTLADATLARELGEQILGDGGHFERSPMYHALALEDVLDLVNLGANDGARVPSMLRWLDAMTHPDGGVSFFNDAALGIAPTALELHAYAQRLGIRAEPLPPGSVHLAASGFARLANDRAVLLADIGSVGPSYQPGHAHAGTLSFELSLDGARLLVNSGTSTYARTAQRLAERGTAAHNTVVVDGRNSSDVWSSFRVGSRARVVDVEVGATTITAAHDGYGALHRRSWELRDDALIIRDRVPHERAEAWLHFAPGTRFDHDRIIAAHGAELTFTVDGGHVMMAASGYHPRFGATLPNVTLRIALRASELVTVLSWASS
jgi:uncharacterized heparinase superfamily protein